MAKFLNYEGLEHLTSWIKNTFLQKNELKIDQIKRNGTTVNPVEKSVNITVPVKLSDLVNDKEFQTKTEITALIEQNSKLKKSIVSELPTSGDENIIYLVSGNGSADDIYDEYLWIDSKWEKIGSTATTVEIASISNAEIDTLLV